MWSLFNFLCFIAICTTITTTFSHEDKEQSIYEVLKANGLPMGLLPKGVKQFNVDDSGRFTVHLDQPCNAMFESQLHYDMNVSGVLGYGVIANLSGIYAQELFLWFPVKGIRVDVPSSGIIYFDVGVVFKRFSLSLFETPRDCLAVMDWELDGMEIQKVVLDDVSLLKRKARDGREFL